MHTCVHMHVSVHRWYYGVGNVSNVLIVTSCVRIICALHFRVHVSLSCFTSRTCFCSWCVTRSDYIVCMYALVVGGIHSRGYMLTIPLCTYSMYLHRLGGYAHAHAVLSLPHVGVCMVCSVCIALHMLSACARDVLLVLHFTLRVLRITNMFMFLMCYSPEYS